MAGIRGAGSLPIAEYDGSGNLLRRYVHGAGVDEPLVWYEGSGTTDRRHLYADERGSIITKEGATTSINTYDEYGIPGSGNTGRFQYTGQAWIAEAGLYYYKARFYNPELGRFMQPDPIGYPDGMNLYNYVGADPVNARDPSGLQQAPTERIEVIGCVVDPYNCRDSGVGGIPFYEFAEPNVAINPVFTELGLPLDTFGGNALTRWPLAQRAMGGLIPWMRMKCHATIFCFG